MSTERVVLPSGVSGKIDRIHSMTKHSVWRLACQGDAMQVLGTTMPNPIGSHAIWSGINFRNEVAFQMGLCFVPAGVTSGLAKSCGCMYPARSVMYDTFVSSLLQAVRRRLFRSEVRVHELHAYSTVGVTTTSNLFSQAFNGYLREQRICRSFANAPPCHPDSVGDFSIMVFPHAQFSS
jgi:hypothetical protein